MQFYIIEIFTILDNLTTFIALNYSEMKHIVICNLLRIDKKV